MVSSRDVVLAFDGGMLEREFGPSRSMTEDVGPDELCFAPRRKYCSIKPFLVRR